MKKKKNAILKSQLEQYEKLLSEVTKEEEDADKKNTNSVNNDSANEMKITNKSGFNMSKNQSKKKLSFIFLIKLGNTPKIKNENIKIKTTSENFGNFRSRINMNDNSEIIDIANISEKNQRFKQN